MKTRLWAGAVCLLTMLATGSEMLRQPPVPMVNAAGLRGDVNQDGQVTSADVFELQSFLLTGNGDSANADWNQDMCVDAVDLTYLKRTLLQAPIDDKGALVINEVCSTNKTALQAADGTSPDWIELYNAGDAPMDVSGMGLSDGDKNRFKFTFPAGTTLAADAYILILCDDTVAVEPPFHAPFKISAAGETIYLTAPDGKDIDIVSVSELDPDVTFGRYANGSSDFALLRPSPGTSNDTVETVYRVEKPTFSTVGGFYDTAFGLTLSGMAGNQILYTLDGSDPRTSSSARTYSGEIRIYDNTSEPNQLSAIQNISLRRYTPPQDAVDKGIVVRAVSKDATGTFSAVASNHYYVGKTASYYTDMKVLSIATDQANFFDNETGIYVVGNQYDRWKNSGSFNPNMDLGDCLNPTNYNSEGKDWERPCNIQVFENGKEKYTEDVGVRISGNWTTAFPQKSMTFYARKEYGSNKMQYDFFEGGAHDTAGATIKEYKKVTLRNGGNAYDNARFRDDLNQSLARNLQLGTQAKCDYIVFLDGEFWGYYSMQEKLDENYLESHYHVDADDVTTMKVGREYEGLASTYASYKEFWAWAMSANLADSANYQRVCETIDVQGLMDFVAFQSFIVNWDCLINCNNWMVWRTDTVDQDNPYADGKWRFLLYDTEYSAGYDTQTRVARNYFKSMDRSGQVTSIGSLFWKLMDNDSFKKQYYDVASKVIQENFAVDAVMASIDAYATRLTPAMDATFHRFGVEVPFASHVMVLRNFFQKRPGYALHHLNLLYGINDDWQEDPNMIDQFGWNLWMNDGSGTISYEADGSVKVQVARTAQYAQVSTGTVELEAGKTYRMTYTIRTSQPVSTYVSFQKSISDYTSYYWKARNFSQDAQTITDTVTMTRSDENVKFLIGLEGVGTYELSDFSLVCVS